MRIEQISSFMDTVQLRKTPPDLPASLPRRASNLTVDVTIRNVIIIIMIVIVITFL